VRIAVVGPGAIGIAVAARLAEAGRCELVLCSRASLERIVLHTANTSLAFRLPILVEAEQARPVDWVLVCTKTYDSESTAPWLRALRRADTPVAVLQNGVEHRERFAAHVPAPLLAPVVVDCPAERLGPGEARALVAGRLTVADDELGRGFARCFEGCELEVSLASDFAVRAWSKLVRNAAGAARAVLRHSAADSPAAWRELASELALEAVLVARAEGVELAPEVARLAAAEAAALPDARVTSLEADLRARRPTELDARNGAVVRIGRRHGVATPCNELAVRVLSTSVAAG
jgi:2-dehydropantoate 2-reductase